MRAHDLFLIGLTVLFTSLLGGCGSTQSAYTGPPADEPVSETASERAGALRAAAQRWRGTPHEWGGTTPDGIDCSGLVQVVYQETLGQTLPRTTRAQARIGTAVSSSAVQPGDLVFFHVDTRKGRHVGIYLSDGDFLHASSSEGVRISSLQNPYWKQRWWQARRLLTDSASTQRADTPSGSSHTGGW